MKNHYFLECTFLEEIDLSNEAIKEFFEYPEDFEITEEDRKNYFEDYLFPEMLKEHKIKEIIDFKYYISNP